MSGTASGRPDRSRSRPPDASPAAHTLLVKFSWPGDGPVASLGTSLTDRALTLVRAVEGDEAYAYVALRTDIDAAHSLAQLVRRALPDAALSRLTLLQDIAGASSGEEAPYHYVVETDVREESDADLNDWYNREHLPGLASVPGTVRAMRFRNMHGHPRYHACYDLVCPQTLGSPPWLKVRGTPWSDRVRPAFYNTKRTMFRRV
jgi:hypothetical protein